MKKIILTILLLAFCVSISGAGITDQMRRVIAAKNAGAPVSSCPSYYASAVLSWDGDHTSGVLNACDSSGNAVLFVDGGSVDISTYGEASSNAIKVDDLNEYMYYTQTSNQYLNPSTAQTICARVYAGAQLTNHGVVVLGRNVGTEYIGAYIDNNAGIRVMGYLRATTAEDGAFGDAIGATTWRTIGYAYDHTNADHSANPGDGVWASTWEDDVDELTEAWAAGMTQIDIGTADWARDYGDPSTTTYYYIDEWAIVTGYKADCTALF